MEDGRTIVAFEGEEDHGLPLQASPIAPSSPEKQGLEGRDAEPAASQVLEGRLSDAMEGAPGEILDTPAECEAPGAAYQAQPDPETCWQGPAGQQQQLQLVPVAAGGLTPVPEQPMEDQRASFAFEPSRPPAALHRSSYDGSRFRCKPTHKPQHGGKIEKPRFTPLEHGTSSL
jgi:hypothetical protein